MNGHPLFDVRRYLTMSPQQKFVYRSGFDQIDKPTVQSNRGKFTSSMFQGDLSEDESIAANKLKAIIPPLRLDHLGSVEPPSAGGKSPSVGLKCASLAVDRGEAFAVLGVNGHGKSSLLHTITRYYKPSAGDAFVVDKSIHRGTPRYNRCIGYVADDPCYQLWDHLTVEEHMHMIGRLRGLPRTVLYLIADATLDACELLPFRDMLACEINYTQRKKLCIAMAALGDPQFILLDEPTSCLDLVSKKEVWRVMSRVFNSKAIMFTTKDAYEAETLATRLGMYVDGQLRILGPVEYMRQKFGEGMEVSVKLSTAAQANQGIGMAGISAHKLHVHNFLLQKFPYAEISSDTGGYLYYHVPPTDLKYRGVCNVFDVYGGGINLGVEQFVFCRPSLEQMLIRLVQSENPHICSPNIKRRIATTSSSGVGFLPLCFQDPLSQQSGSFSKNSFRNSQKGSSVWTDVEEGQTTSYAPAQSSQQQQLLPSEQTSTSESALSKESFEKQSAAIAQYKKMTQDKATLLKRKEVLAQQIKDSKAGPTRTSLENTMSLVEKTVGQLNANISALQQEIIKEAQKYQQEQKLKQSQQEVQPRHHGEKEIEMQAKATEQPRHSAAQSTVGLTKHTDAAEAASTSTSLKPAKPTTNLVTGGGAVTDNAGVNQLIKKLPHVLLCHLDNFKGLPLEKGLFGASQPEVFVILSTLKIMDDQQILCLGRVKSSTRTGQDVVFNEELLVAGSDKDVLVLTVMCGSKCSGQVAVNLADYPQILEEMNYTLSLKLGVPKYPIHNERGEVEQNLASLPAADITGSVQFSIEMPLLDENTCGVFRDLSGKTFFAMLYDRFLLTYDSPFCGSSGLRRKVDCFDIVDVSEGDTSLSGTTVKTLNMKLKNGEALVWVWTSDAQPVRQMWVGALRMILASVNNKP